MSTTTTQQSDYNEAVTAELATTASTSDVQVPTQEPAQIQTEPSGDAAPLEHHEEDGSATAPAPEKVLCGVCNMSEPKYKCPRCYLPYCSVACNKLHRENHPPDPEPKTEPEQPLDTQNNTTNQSPDPKNPFRALETSDKLRLLFQKYPGLPNQLLQIHAATLPPQEGASQKSGIPASLLKGLPPKKETWNHDIGIQNGKEALRKARRAGGEQGDAIREYSELILHLINTHDSESDVAELLRQQLAQEDSKLIERLMTEERR